MRSRQGQDPLHNSERDFGRLLFQPKCRLWRVLRTSWLRPRMSRKCQQRTCSVSSGDLARSCGSNLKSGQQISLAVYIGLLAEYESGSGHTPYFPEFDPPLLLPGPRTHEREYSHEPHET